MIDKVHSVLVYGTLRPFKNEEIVRIGGKLYDLGWYPGIVLSDDPEINLDEGTVVCERINDVTDERLAALDSYEGYYENDEPNSLYLRRKVGDDWIYVYNRTIDPRYQPQIESGDWEDWSANKEKVIA